MTGKRHGGVRTLLSVFLAFVMVIGGVPSEALSVVVDTYEPGASSSTVTDVVEVAPQGGSEGQKKPEGGDDAAPTPSADTSGAGGTEAGGEGKKSESKVVHVRLEPGFEGVERVADIDVTLDGAAWSLPKGVYEREGYEFVGWSTTMDGHDVADDAATPDVDESRAAVPVVDGQEMVDFRFLVDEKDADGVVHEVERDLAGYVSDDVLVLWAQWKRVEAPKDEAKEEEGSKEEVPEDKAAKAADDKSEDALKDETAKSVKDEESKEAENDIVKDDAARDENTKKEPSTDATIDDIRGGTGEDETPKDAKGNDLKDVGKDEVAKSGKDVDGGEEEKAKDEVVTEIKDEKGENAKGDENDKSEDKAKSDKEDTDAKTAKDETGKTGDTGKRYTHRLIVGMSPTTAITVGTVLGKLDGAVLLGFEDEGSLEKAEALYKLTAEYVARDMPLGASAGEDVKDVEMGVTDNPFAVAEEVAKPLSAPVVTQDVLVGLLDTGASEDKHVVESVSVMGDDVKDVNGHASRMLDTMVKENENVRVMSVKVLDDAGHGTASSVYAGVMHAVDNGAKVINMSFAGPDTEGNAAIREAVSYALDHGVIVIAAAGNGGYDASLVTPANVEGVFAVGAADKNGEVLASSNRGTCVGVFVEASSTSVAAARVSGQVSLGLDGWRERVSKMGVGGGEIEVPIETMPVGDGVRASENHTITFDAGEGTFEGGGKTNTISYSQSDLMTKYAHTSNISDAGVRNGNYSNYQRDKQVVQVPGATSLHVSLTYGTENYCDQVFVIRGTYTGNVNLNMNASGQLGKYQGGNNTTSTVEFDVDGDTVTFAFYSDSSNSYYGYYAVVTGVLVEATGSYKEPIAPSGTSFWHWVNESGDVVNWQDCTTTQTLTAVYGNTKAHFMANGGTGTMTDLSLVPGVTAPYCTFTGPSDKPYFAYWTTAADGSGVRYEPGDTLPYEADLTLYAQYVSRGDTIACAVLDSDGTLTFFRSGLSYANGSTGTFYDIDGVSRSGTLYTGFETESYTSGSYVPWNADKAKVLSVCFAQEIKPSSTAYWFNGCTKLVDFDSTNLDTSNVTNMSNMFYNCLNASFNLDVSNWDTSNVTDMSSMFASCYGAAFNPDVSPWDTSSVTNMSKMFYQCRGAAFNPNVSSWDTSNVTNMSYTFSNCYGAAFNPNVSAWDTSSVTNMSEMFSGCNGAVFNPDVSAWDTSKVTTMSSMFFDCYGAAFNPNVSNWDTSNVTGMTSMFYNCYGAAFNPNVSNWDTSNVTGMTSMFYNCYGAAFNPDVSNWDTSNVTSMTSVFYNCHGAVFDPDVSNWDISNVTNVSSMFYNCYGVAFNPNVSNWDTSNVTNMSSMFYNCYGAAFAPDVSKWDTSSITNMSSMFYNCRGAAFTSVDLSGWDVGHVQNASNMFNGCSNLKTIYAHPSADWSALTQMTSSNSMFSGCSQLRGGAGTRYNSRQLDKGYARVDGLGSNQGYFTARGVEPIRHYAILDSTGKLTFFDAVGELATGTGKTVTDVDGTTRSGELFHVPNSMYPSASSVPWYNRRTSISSVCFAQETSPTSMASWFYGCYNLSSFDMTNLDTSKVTNMSHMFEGCSNAAFNPDVSNWDTSNVTDMSCMFYDCHGAAFNPDVSAWDTSSVTSMSSMFYYCSGAAFNPDVSNWDTSSVTSMSSMFYNCYGAAFNPDVSEWDISNVTNMSSMFYNCHGAAFDPDVSEWDTSSVKDMSSMFYYCYGAAFNPDVSAWDTSSVTNMGSTFSSCYGAAFNPDVSDWDTSKVTFMGNMFFQCRGAAFNPDVSDWDTSKATSMTNMFGQCYGAAFNPDVSNWDTSKVTDMSNMFIQCYGAAFNPDVSDWDTSKVTNMSNMFSQCYGAAFTSIDVSGWDFSKITSTSNYLGLQQCNNLKRLTVSVNSKITGVPEHSAQGKYLSTWENEERGIYSASSAEMMSAVNSGLGAGTWLWESASHVVLKKIDSVTSNGLSGATFELRDMMGNVIESGITSSADGTFGLSMDEYGDYLLVETGAPEGHSISADGWLVSVTAQGVTVRSNGTKTADGIVTHNESSKPTVALTDADKADAYQKNYQLVTRDGFTVTKQSEWIDIVQERIRTTITVQTPELPPSRPNAKKDRVVYAFTTCNAHGFSEALARRNVDLLLDNYEHVDLIIADGRSVRDLRILCDVTSTDVLDSIVFAPDQHWAVNLFTGLDEYLKTHDPSVVYVSHDRLIDGDGANWDRSMEGTWDKLKAYQAQGRYFEVRGGYRLDAETTTSLGWKTIAGFIDPSSWNGYDTSLDMSIVTDVEANVDKPFDVLGFEYEDLSVNKVASTRLSDVVSSDIRVRDYSVTGDAVVTLIGRSLSMALTGAEPGSTVTVTIDGTALNAPTGSWFDTNDGDLTLSDVRRIDGTTIRTDISVPSPKLSKPTYTYTGDLLAKNGDKWLVPDDPIRTHDLIILKTDGTNPLADATFTLTGTSDDGHAVSEEVTSGTSGIVAFESIREGTYTLTETKAPTGYTAMVGEVTVTVTADGISIPGVQQNGTGQFVIPNHRNTSQVTLRKVDATTKAVLAGAKFSVIGRNEAGDLVDLEVTTGEDGCASIDLAPGTLWVKETVAPTGYVLDPSAHQLKVVSGNEVYWDGTRLDGTVVNIENVEASSTLTIVKQWVDNGGDRPAPNIDVSGPNGFFLRTDESTVWEKAGNTWTLTIGVPAGLTFSVWEDGCPGYVSSNPDGSPLTVSSGGSATITNTVKSQAPVTHKVTLLKTASDTHMGLGGATFRLCDTVTNNYAVVNESGTVVGWATQAQASTLMSSGNGYLEVRGLSAGSYAFEEVAAPTGYDVTDDATFVLAADGTLTGSSVIDGLVAMVDDPAQSAVEMPGTGGTGVSRAGAILGLALVIVPCAVIARRRRVANK